MKITSQEFKANVRHALADHELKDALSKLTTVLRPKREAAVAELPEFDALKEHGIAIKNHVLDHLDDYLEQFENNVVAQGGHVHWCVDSARAKDMVLEICRSYDARTVNKGKSMLTEEMDLNKFLDQHGILPLETDLGEYIIQLRNENPSHITAPAIHLHQEEIAQTFIKAHAHLDASRSLDTAEALTEEVRQELRPSYERADIGITGANFMVAETGSTIIVTNEGNGDLTQTLAKTHIVIASIEKILPNLEDAGVMLRLLARSATGQDANVYTTLSSAPALKGDLDGPQNFHVIIVDNGRTSMLGREDREMLRCIRCSACLNNCPVYANIGGHAYGWVYSGPMGKIWTPALLGLEKAPDLPHASSFCGKCQEVCPVGIPLVKLMRNLRSEQHELKITPFKQRFFLWIWAFFASRPKLYRLTVGFCTRLLSIFAGKSRRFHYINGFGILGLGGWLKTRDIIAPERKSFSTIYKEYKKGEHDG